MDSEGESSQSSNFSEEDESSSDESEENSDNEEESTDSEEDNLRNNDQNQNLGSNGVSGEEEFVNNNVIADFSEKDFLKPDEYEHDSSDEEDLRNTVGDIPMHWYDDMPHIGYDWDGEKIIKPIQGDEIDEFMKKMDDPNYWRTVRDPNTGQNVVLTDEDLSVIDNIQKSRYPDGNFDPYQPFEDFFTYQTMIHPVTDRPEHKRSFIPSKVEKEKVSKMVHAIKMGWIRPYTPKPKGDNFFALWEENEKMELTQKMQRHISAPKMKLPGHAESYNPPPEYLFTPEEEAKWKKQDPERRRLEFIPQKYSSLRLVPGYANFIKERFERCLDLYLCPRQIKMKVNVEPEQLIPKLPKPQDLQPFPTTLSIVYKGHKDIVRTLSLDPSGQFFSSGSDDQSVRIWEILTSRCLKVIQFDSIIQNVAWCPNPTMMLLAVTVGNNLHIMNPGVGNRNTVAETDNCLHLTLDEMQTSTDALPQPFVKWTNISIEDPEYKKGHRVIVTHQHQVEQISWHTKGDYFSTVTRVSSKEAVLIHQLSSRKTQAPFKASKGIVQKVMFHPLRPYFFVATQKHVRIYNLLKQQLTKKLLCNVKWLSSIAIHPQGDNVIIGSFDARLTWFDLDLSVKPYKTLRHHKKAIRQVCFHKKYPLFASGSDDGTVVICHGMVYNDLLQNPLIVPVKILRGHQITKGMGVMDCQYHPTQPWVVSAGADGNLHLYT